MRTHALIRRTNAAPAKAEAGAGPGPARPEVRRILHTPRPQMKLLVSRPDDGFEHEADRVAEEVMRMSPPNPMSNGSTEGSQPTSTLEDPASVGEALQRQAADEMQDAEGEDEIISAKLPVQGPSQRMQVEASEAHSPGIQAGLSHLLRQRLKELRARGQLLQRQPMEEEDEEETIQADAMPGRTPKVTPDVHAQISGLDGAGQPLPKSVRAFFEPRFGLALDRVTVHTGARAADAANALNARAYTIGRDIVFGAGQYTPGTDAGRKVLAHEVTHVLQQEGTDPTSGHAGRHSHAPVLVGGAAPTRQRTARPAPGPQAQRSNGTQAVTEAEDPVEIVDTFSDDDVNDLIDAFPDDLLRQQIGTSSDKRRDFLKGMQRYLGSLDEVVAHYSQVRPVRVPGNVHLHDMAASRLEMVQDRLTDLGMGMPASNVALGLRNRYRPHTRHSKSKMAHPTGFAIDYRATHNPHITDRRLVLLFTTLGGRSVQPDLGLRRGARRDLIQAIGRQMGLEGRIGLDSDLGRQARQFLSKMQTEIRALAQMAKRFTQSLPEPSKIRLRELARRRNELGEVTASLTRLLRRRRRTEQLNQEIEFLRTRQQELASQLSTLRTQLEEIFAPWLAQLQPRIQQLTDVFPAEQLEQAVEQRSLRRRRSQQRRAASRLRRLERRISQKERVVERASDRAQTRRRERLERDLEQMQAEREVLVGQLDTLNSEIRLAEARIEYRDLMGLQDALLSDEFVFQGERPVENPPVVQLINTGFFQPDVVREGVAFNPRRDGFTVHFMLLMAAYGFDQGLNWSPGSTDAMHFELVEGVESLRSG